MKPRKIFDVVGARHGRLTIIAEAVAKPCASGGSKRMVEAVCDCGVFRTCCLASLRSGNTKSCGCLNVEVARTRERETGAPQIWCVEGSVAWIYIGTEKVIIDAADVDLVGKYRWAIHHGYARCHLTNMLLHRLIFGLPAGDQAFGDHKFHNTLDNRRSELRATDRIGNARNRWKGRNNNNRFKGYSLHQGKYEARINIGGGKQVTLGYFSSETAAAAAYNSAAVKHHGEFACLNDLSGALS